MASALVCKLCGGAKPRFQTRCSRCWSIEMTRRRPALCGSADEIHLRNSCEICVLIHKEMVSRSLRAVAAKARATHRQSHPHLNPPEWADRRWAGWAIMMVGRAVKAGLLPALDGSIKCADCSAPAKCYDHRDYGRPLDVHPVCRGCNAKRGTAKWPQVPYRSQRREAA